MSVMRISVLLVTIVGWYDPRVSQTEMNHCELAKSHIISYTYLVVHIQLDSKGLETK